MHWPGPLTEEEGGEAAEKEEVWHAILDRNAGKLSGEDTKMLEKNFPSGNWEGRQRLWLKNEEDGDTALSKAIGVQWENIADIVVYLWEA